MTEIKSIPDDIDIETLWYVVDLISREVGKRGVEILKEKLESEGLTMTDGLAKSLRSEVKSDTGWSTNLIVEFWEYGRFKDMKYTSGHGNMPGRKYIENMESFVESVMNGSDPFTHISGRLSFPIDKQEAITSLAWALARGALKSVINERNNNGWYIRNYMKEIYGEMEVNIQAAAAQAVLNTMKYSLKGKK